jgi:hypothetical protein
MEEEEDFVDDFHDPWSQMPFSALNSQFILPINEDFGDDITETEINGNMFEACQMMKVSYPKLNSHKIFLYRNHTAGILFYKILNILIDTKSRDSQRYFEKAEEALHPSIFCTLALIEERS